MDKNIAFLFHLSFLSLSHTDFLADRWVSHGIFSDSCVSPLFSFLFASTLHLFDFFVCCLYNCQFTFSRQKNWESMENDDDGYDNNDNDTNNNTIFMMVCTMRK